MKAPQSPGNGGQPLEVIIATPSAPPSKGGLLLDAASRSIRKHLVLPDYAADAITLWIAHTHCYERFVCSPRLNVTSAERGCGKTVLRNLVAALVPRCYPVENITTAAMFRLVDSVRPTLLADEYDRWLLGSSELIGLLNAGHTLGGVFARCEGKGVRSYLVFGPAALFGIGPLPTTLHDRSIVIRLEKAKPTEIRERFDPRNALAERELMSQLAEWTRNLGATIASHQPLLPRGAVNRKADNWRPLFTLAELAGETWPGRAKTAFERLSAVQDLDAEGLNVALLADLRIVFKEAAADRMFSRDIVEALVKMSERPWSEARRGGKISEYWLARLLRNFSITSVNIRIGACQAKGYRLEQFQDAFERYLLLVD